MRILVTDGMDKSALAVLKEQGHEIVEHFYAPEELGDALRDFDAVVIRSATKIRKPQLEKAQGGRLKVIIRGGVGIDNIDADTAKSMGIDVRNTPLASTNAVAELAVALMFSCARFISIAGYSMRQDKWDKKAYSKAFELSGKTLGVIGYGRIGSRIGAICGGMGMNVIAYEQYRNPAIDQSVYVDSFDDFLSRADIISVNTPALASPIINRDTIAKMKDGVVIINASRGCNIDEDALLEALNSGKVRAAGLDVWVDEPSRNHDLYCHPAVSCTPHVGASTVEAQKRVGAEIVAIINSYC